MRRSLETRLLILSSVVVAVGGCKKGTTIDEVEDTIPAIIEHCGTIEDAETWLASSEHHLTCEVVVQGVLTIEPGVTVLADAGTALIIDGGVLEAEGTSDEPLLFSSSAAFPVAGDWRGVVGQDGVVQLSWATVRYGGSEGGVVHLEGGAAALSNVLLSNGEHQGLSADEVDFTLLEELELSYVDEPLVIPWPAAQLLCGVYLDSVETQAVRLTGAILEEPVGLSPLEVPYLSDGLAVVGDGNLWIEAGATLAVTGDIEVSNGGAIVLRGDGADTATIRGWEDAQFGIHIQSDAELADIRLSSIEGGTVLSDIADLSFRSTSISEAPGDALTITGGVDTEVYSQLSDCVFAGEGAGLVVPLRLLPYVGENDYGGSAFDGIVVGESTIVNDLELASWPSAAVKVAGDITLQAGHLALHGSRTLLFEDDVALLVEGGSLELDNMTLTHVDEVPGGWRGITIGTGADASSIDRSEVAFGGQIDGANITVEAPAEVTIAGNAISHSAGWGVLLERGSSATLEDNTFDGNAQGDVGP